MFDHMQLGAVALVIIGLDRGIGVDFLQKTALFKDSSLEYLSIHRSPTMLQLIRCCEIMFKKICQGILDILRAVISHP